MKLNICFISWSYVIAGGTTSLLEYSNSLSKLGHDVTIIGRGNKDVPLKHNRITTILFYDGNHEKVDKLIFFFKAVKILLENNYDIVNVYNSPLICMLKVAAICKSAKWVLHIRSPAVTNNIIGRLKNFLTFLNVYLFRYIAFIDNSLSDKFLMKSKKYKQILELPLGVNPDIFYPRKNCRQSLFPFEANWNIFIYVGSIDAERNIADLIKAFEIVLKSYKKCGLVLIGSGTDLINLKSMIIRKKIDDHVFCVGKINYFEVPNYLSSADIALSYIPINEIYDNQPPLKSFEYLQMNLPLVATKTKSHQEKFKGRAILCGDSPEEFAKGMRLALDECGEINSNATPHQKFLKQFYWDNIVLNRLYPFYQKIVMN
jgi:glycosyltransferase involved in cell wall biosynthesis